MNKHRGEKNMQEFLNRIETIIPISGTNRKKYFIVFGIIGIIITGALGYWYWTKTPQYSLKLVQEAVVKHDLATFDKLVDLDTIIPRAIDQLIDAKMNDPENVQDESMKNFAMGFLNTFKPTMVSSAKDQIRSYVEKGNFEQPQNNGENKEKTKFKVEEIYNNAIGGTSEFKGIDYVKKDGMIAVVGTKVFMPKLGKEAILEFKMRQIDGYWQVAEINNLGEFILMVEKLKKEKLAELNKPLLDQIAQNIQFSNVRMMAGNNNAWGISKVVRFPVVITNVGTQSVSELGAVINVKSADGKYLLKYPVKFAGSTLLGPGASSDVSWKKDINPFIASDEVLYKAVGGNISIEIVCKYIKFADGTELKIEDKLP